MKPVDVKSCTYIDVDNDVRIIKIQKHFCKGLRSKLVLRSFVITKVKNTFPWTHTISDIKDEEVVGTFYKI